MDEREELERLQARVAELEGELESRQAEAAAPRPGRAPGRTPRWRSIVSAFLVVLACVLAPLSVASVWAKTTISNTDRYVETVAPLAHDPAVQTAISTEVTRAVFDNLDLQTLTKQALTTVAQQPKVPPRVAAALPGLAVPITNGVENFTRDQVHRLVASPQFATLWDQVNRVAHTQVVKLLEGNQGGVVSAQGNTVTLNLAPVIAQVKQRLVAEGFGLAANIPTVNKSFVLMQSDAIPKAQGFYRLLTTLGTWLPFVALAFLVGGVAVAGDRRRTLLRGALGVTGAMLVLGVGLALLRSWYVDTTPGNVLTSAGAGSVFDTLVRFLRTSLRTLAVLGLVVALAAFLTGPSAAAVRTRGSLKRGIASLRGGAEAAGWHTGRVGVWTYAHRRALRIALVVAGGLVLVFWSSPNVWVVVGTAAVVLLLVGVVEMLATPPATPTAPEAPTAPPVAAAPTEAPAPAEAAVVPRQVPRGGAGEEPEPAGKGPGPGEETR